MPAFAAAADVIHFWFGEPPGDLPRAQWFRKDDAFDDQIRQRFGAQVERALDGALREWDATPTGALARILLLDQFTRNLFRGSARSFAGDTLALAAARELVARGEDRWLGGTLRWFAYLPFEHAEDAAAQAQSLRLFAALSASHPHLSDAEVWARKHADVVARFGRYPHRNALLQRESTAQERDFLRQPGSSF